MRLGEYINQLRLAEGATYSQYAKRLGVSISYLHDCAVGRRDVALKRAVLFAQALKQDPAEFVRMVLQHELDEAGVNMMVKVKR